MHLLDCGRNAAGPLDRMYGRFDRDQRATQRTRGDGTRCAARAGMPARCEYTAAPAGPDGRADAPIDSLKR